MAPMPPINPGDEYFDFNGREHHYFHTRLTHHTERRMEVSLGIPFAQRYQKNMIEVGNVTRQHKREFHHFTIDLNEKHPTWENYANKDVLTYQPEKELQGALSLSTLEHTEDPATAIHRVLSWAPNVLITIPLGYRCACGVLTDDVMNKHAWPEAEIHIMQRTTDDNQWRQIDREEYDNLTPDQIRYGNRFPFANLVAIWLKGVL